MAVDFDQLADTIVDKVGGAGNIKRAQHCATRLRLELRDEAKADTDGIKALEGVVTVVLAGGQYQVVVGDEVPKVHAGIMRHLGGAPVEEEEEAPQGSVLDRFIKMVSAIFHPILWPLAGEVDPVTRTPSWRVPLSGPAGEDVLDGNNEEAEDVHPGVPA